jgi:DNA (cytosine-5)-methyltransferase 1
VRYLSVCSGIEAATVAWHPLGWEAAAYSEIEPFPRAVLAHHYPDTPCHGDFTTIGADDYGPIDLLVGGTPCQDFSIAGLRAGLGGERGNLTLEFLRLLGRTRARWVVWENVPGALSSVSHVSPDLRPPEIDLDAGNGPKDGEEVVVEDSYDADESHAFACFLAGLSELGYGWAYRVLDAQFTGVPQRRRREFVVGYLGDWRRAAAVLFERHSLQGNPPPRRETGPSVAALTANGVGTCGADDNQAQAGHIVGSLCADSHPGAYSGQDAYTGRLIAANAAPALTSNPYGDHESREGLLVAHSLRGEGFDASEDGTGRGTPLIPVNLPPCCGAKSNPTTGAGGRTGGSIPPTGPIAFSAKDHGADAMEDCSPTLRAGGYTGSHANGGVMPAVAFSIMPMNSGKDYKARETDVAQPIMAGGPVGGNQGGDYIVPFDTTQITSAANYSQPKAGDPCHPLAAGAHPPAIAGSAVRRLTPRECERLQGFPDDYTLVPYRNKPAADGPRYKALGNSMAVPCMRWIGERIAAVDAVTSDVRRAA